MRILKKRKGMDPSQEGKQYPFDANKIRKETEKTDISGKRRMSSRRGTTKRQSIRTHFMYIYILIKYHLRMKLDPLDFFLVFFSSWNKKKSGRALRYC